MIYDLNIILQLLPFTPKDIEYHTKYNLYSANFGSSCLSSELLGCHQERLVISDSGDKGKQPLFQEPSRHPTPPARQKCSWEKPQRGLLKKTQSGGGFVQATGQDNVGAMVWLYGTVMERSFCPPARGSQVSVTLWRLRQVQCLQVRKSWVISTGPLMLETDRAGTIKRITLS
mgnify:CR=1 FL=1